MIDLPIPFLLLGFPDLSLDNLPPNPNGLGFELALLIFCFVNSLLSP